MSSYLSEDGVPSVGRALEKNVAFSVSHPLYQSLIASMESKAAELSAARGAMRTSATPSLVSTVLSTEELSALAADYPEFRLVNLGTMRFPHAHFVQARRLAAHWCLMQAHQLAARVVFHGVPLVPALEAGFERVALVVDESDPVAVHERYSVSSEAHSIYADFVGAGLEAGVALRRGAYDDFLRREGVTIQAAGGVSPSGDVLCVDGCLVAYSPAQVAFLMAAAGASVAYGFVPYHHSMLLNASGELPGVGVTFERVADDVRFAYPEGVAGVSRYQAGSWRAWLTSHTFALGSSGSRAYQLELLKVRGSLLFYRIVEVEGVETSTDVVHALELPSEQPQYVVSSWRLAKLGLDPAKQSNWLLQRYLVSQRLVDRVYQFAMQLPKEQFSRFAVRKQIRVVNDRVTIEGTNVRVNSSLGEDVVDALVVDIFCRAYVDRYDAGTLTTHAREVAEALAGFSSMSFGRKLWALVSLSALSAWECTLAPVNQYVRSACDSVRDVLSGRHAAPVAVFQRAPSYALVDARAFGLDVEGGQLAAAELTRQAACLAEGYMSSTVRFLAEAARPAAALAATFRVESFGLCDTPRAQGGDVDVVVESLRALNPVDEAPIVRHALEVATAVRAASSERVMDFEPVADPVYVFNEFYSAAIPGVAEQNLEYDTASVSLDPQDRHLAAPYMRLPKYFGDAPKPKLLYHSKVRALNVPKRQQTLQELLSAIAARNLNAPQVALPQDDAATAVAVWENFLNEACVPDARERLKAFKRDLVFLEEDAFREWATQATPEKLAAVRRELEDKSQSLAEMPVEDYLVMLKADVKPTLSTKPLSQRTEPQVIVYHEKALSSFYSSVFRVLVRRFLSLLKPNYHVNLLKDTKDMEAFVRGVHPFGVATKFLENDFSKYDKSQGRFVFVLEELVFRELGMNAEALARWLGGHVRCSLRSVALGLSLHVLYQRKSGDATTAFGNVVLNVLSVSYAYRGTQVLWALFMGDDSLVCASSVAHADDAVAVLAEVFNLGAKTYMTDSPYFASNFVLIDPYTRQVNFVPDPVKRIERWSMAVSGEEPMWAERHVSARDSLGAYLNCSKTVLLPRLVAERYNVAVEACGGLADAVATVVGDRAKFRGMWHELPETSNY